MVAAARQIVLGEFISFSAADRARFHEINIAHSILHCAIKSIDTTVCIYMYIAYISLSRAQILHDVAISPVQKPNRNIDVHECQYINTYISYRTKGAPSRN